MCFCACWSLAHSDHWLVDRSTLIQKQSVLFVNCPELGGLGKTIVEGSKIRPAGQNRPAWAHLVNVESGKKIHTYNIHLSNIFVLVCIKVIMFMIVLVRPT